MRLNPQETTDLVTFTEEIHSGKLQFLYTFNYGPTQRLSVGTYQSRI